ncbi:MAG: 4Fe-4S binding protein [Proteobacteria bacterium]|nr:4Fe-4S binding protein [Pseudomonadota bacterium]
MKLPRLIPNALRSLFRRPTTRRYPAEVRKPYAGSRGEIVNDASACILCGLCARRCPTSCIEVDKHLCLWVHDPFACVLCGWCAEVCPTDSLTQTEQRPTPRTVRQRTELHPTPPQRPAKPKDA